MVRTRFALILYFRMVAHKAACHTLSKAFLKLMKTCSTISRKKLCVNVLLHQFSTYIRFFIKVLIETNVNITIRLIFLMFIEM